MSFRPKPKQPPEGHLNIKEFIGLVQASEQQKMQSLTDEELIRLCEKRNMKVVKDASAKKF